MAPVLLILATAALAAVAFVCLALWLRRIAAEMRGRLDIVAAGRIPRRSSGAQSYGIRSRGKAQLRGNGGLALYDDELVFIQMVGNNDARIPLADIVKVERVSHHLGKATLGGLLFVEWKTADGTDAIAWKVPDLDDWVRDLNQVQR